MKRFVRQVPVRHWPVIVWGLLLEWLTTVMFDLSWGGRKVGPFRVLLADGTDYKQFSSWALKASAHRGWHTYMGWRFWIGEGRPKSWAKAGVHDQRWRTEKAA